MKLIKITTDNEISVHEFPEGNYSEQNEALAIPSCICLRWLLSLFRLCKRG